MKNEYYNITFTNKFNSYVGHFLNGIFSGNGIFYDDETKGRY